MHLYVTVLHASRSLRATSQDVHGDIRALAEGGGVQDRRPDSPRVVDVAGLQAPAITDAEFSWPAGSPTTDVGFLWLAR
jgi:hypothetical protein